MNLYLTMPKPGETIHEGLIINWLKKEGEFVYEKEPLVELETQKAVFTFESPFRGTLQKILVSANENTPVGEKIALFEVSKEDGVKYEMLGVGLAENKTKEEPPHLNAFEISEEEEKLNEKEMTSCSTKYSPYLRKLIQQNHLSETEISQIPHSGFEGRLSKEDLHQYLENKKNSCSKNSNLNSKLIPLSPIRQRIAKQLTESVQEIPQAASSIDVDLTSIMQFRASHQESFKTKMGFSLSPFLFFAWAVKEQLKKTPLWNAHCLQQNHKLFIQTFDEINLSFATSTPQGLMTPVIKKAQDLDFLNLAIQMKKLEAKAKLGNLSPEELSDATFLVNNPGALGGNRAHQILPKPLVGIVALNKIEKKAWVIGEGIFIRDISTIDLSFDHRVMDGAEAIQFVEALKTNLENFNFSELTKQL